MTGPVRRAGAGTAVRSRPHRFAVWAALAVLYLVWGGTYLAIRVLVRQIPPAWAGCLRFWLAALLMGAFAVWRARRRGTWPSAGQIAGACATGALIVGGSLGLLTLGEQHVPSGLASLLIATMPLMVVVLRLAHRDPPGRRALLGLAAGFAALTVLLLGGGGAASPVWMLLVVLAAACEAVGAYYAGRWQMPEDAAASSALQMATGGAIWLAVTLAARTRAPGEWPAAAIGALAYLVLAGTVLAYGAFVWLLARVPASLVATYAYVNPVVAVVLGALVLGEPLTVRSLTAAVLVVGAVVLVVSGEQPAPTTPSRSAHARADLRAATRRVRRHGTGGGRGALGR